MSSTPYKPRAVAAHLATEADLDGVAETLGLAFQDDPVWSWAFAVPEHGPEALRAAWRFVAGSALDYGWVWHADGHAAAALWIPPGKPEIKPEDEEPFESLIEELAGDSAARLFATWECFDRAHEVEQLQQPYYYLSLLGVHPDHAGEGLGMGLAADNLKRIDAEGVAAYLESSNPANNYRYERLGFLPFGKFQLPEDGPDVLQMWRAPR